MTPSKDRSTRHAAVATLVQQNLQLLQQVRALLVGISESVYCAVQTPLDSSIGAHVRHILEYYEQFVAAQGALNMSYDARERCPELESRPAVALERIDALSQVLLNLADDQPLQMHHALITGGTVDTHSSVARELAYLLDHTTHHLAIVSIAGRLAQLKWPAELGYAASTLQYQHNQNDSDGALSSHA